MEFRLLGPVELWADGQRRRLGTAKERCVLASLLLTPGRPVPAETLIDRLWDDSPPAKPRQSLYTYITRLRERFAEVDDVDLPSRSGTYLLRITDEEAIDWHRFRTLRNQARAMADSGDDDTALDLHREAAQLWRAEPLADLSGDWVSRTRRSMEDDLLAATFDRVDIELRLGHHADLVGELSDLLARFPWVEKFAEQLMLALFRSGRQAEALEVYRQARGRLIAELGTEAWPRLQELHQRILRGDPSLLYKGGIQKQRSHTPNTLPRDIHTFTGRQREIEQLLESLPHQQATQQSQGATILAIDGMPGVGKTTLAVHLAHRLAEHYPDGQLYVDLHGHDPGRQPADPAAVLDAQLRVIGVPPEHIPRTLDDRVAVWRSKLADRRMLIVLDDASGGDQVLPLLPGSPGSLIILASRRSLSGLEDARCISLDVFTPEEAKLLFANIAGADRTLNERELSTVIQQCGNLPLAIQIAGSRLRHRSHWSVGDLITRLTPDDQLLAELRTESRAITTVFEMSYRGLSVQQRKAFRLCSMHPGSDFTARTASVALCTNAVMAERVLDELLDRHLIIEPVRGRYRYHDLLRRYAQWRILQEDTAQERQDAVKRMLDHYLWVAAKADRLLYPHRHRIALPVTYPSTDPPTVGTDAEAQSWLTSEHGNLISAPHLAGTNGWNSYIAHFAHVLADYLESGGYWEEAARLHDGAVDAWRERGDQTGLSSALADLSIVRWRMGDHDRALESAEEALDIRRSLADHTGQADLLDHIGQINWHRSDFEKALTGFQEAYTIRRRTDDKRGQADALSHMAFVLFHTGKYSRAHRELQRSLAIYQSIGDQGRQMMALNNIGDVELRLGNHDVALSYYESAAQASEMNRQHKAIWRNNVANVLQHREEYETALEYYRESLATYRQIGDRRCETDVLINIGSTFQRMNRLGEAFIHHQKALSISQDIGERFEQTRALLHIGQVHQQSGRYSAALESLQRALELAGQIKDPYEEARALEGIGEAMLHTEGHSQARRRWRLALRLYQPLGVPEAEALRQRLRNAEAPGGA